MHKSFIGKGLQDTKMIQRIYPSVMAQTPQEMDALFTKLDGVAKELHLDMADGQAVPGTANNFPLELSDKFTYNAHLMIKNPEKWIEQYGNRMRVSVPMVEEISDIPKYISWMKGKNYLVGFSLNPETSYDVIKPYINDIDVVLILTVNPGFYGAKYLKEPLEKIAQIKADKPGIEVIVDGGMNPTTIKDAVSAGADHFVSGSFISKAEDSKKAMRELQRVVLIKT
jgi:ribulose-phosphate 3-epimerase